MGFESYECNHYWSIEWPRPCECRAPAWPVRKAGCRAQSPWSRARRHVLPPAVRSVRPTLLRARPTQRPRSALVRHALLRSPDRRARGLSWNVAQVQWRAWQGFLEGHASDPVEGLKKQSIYILSVHAWPSSPNRSVSEACPCAPDRARVNERPLPAVANGSRAGRLVDSGSAAGLPRPDRADAREVLGAQVQRRCDFPLGGR